ncbi:Dicarboxylate carrier MatC domain protein [Pseudarthrobacter chlorophenolicus A6]|uniref:Dicarboxylate carrier MatC domain protein n=1 Tax=Pseudarthrobacter chlorophenolicus (strain ATCC 700700 / DSM 12829 / CIP 107037 / JCM 12360 / KCTC 9906 / NCIMB 13794 / A6) TaxID=452863 RepID=B8H9B4_PSECP|nr:SLC13 family permease [Pseudarthrobacter chlorophenolicus]ACL38273.1 Dicarboxylate carrier MatC domain protein [Pseudarthrobacter chlorophenolicus A6]SDQ51937.1 Di-and tricarboxylate transporter [Pseudarthrobacter chlorophenolicus]
MSAPVLSIIILAAMFLLATVLPLNMGALAFVGAFLLGALVLGMSTNEILANFPGGLFLTIVGVTYLFAIAQNNGTIDLLVRGAVRLVGSRVALIPWVMFAITAVITAVGALSPAAVAIIAPIALSFAGKYKISPLLMGMMVIHGAQAGGFSPIAVYGVTVNGIIAKTDLAFSPTALFLSSLIFNIVIAVVLFAVLGGRALLSSRVGHFVEQAAEARMSVSVGAKAGTDVAFKGFGSGMYGPRDPAGDGVAATRERSERIPQLVTIAGLVVLAVVALGFKMDVGFVSITIAIVLALVSPAAQKGAINKISWSTVLLICGMLTFVGVLEEAGTIEFVSNGVAGMGMPLVAALLICFIGAIVSAFASSTAILAALIPLAVPFLSTGDIGAVGVICALAVAATIVDVSPFSTNGALVLANAPEGVDKDKFYKQILGYSGIVIVAGPVLAWLALVVPGWL